MTRRLTVFALCALLCACGSDVGDRVGEAVDRVGEGVANGADQLGDAATQLTGRLAEARDRALEGLDRGVTRTRGQYLDPVPGTLSYEVTLPSHGLERTVRIIQPEAPVASAPVLVVLHYSGGTNENMANLTRIGRLAADHGVWIVLPDGIGGQWNDDPAAPSSVDDIAFLDDVIAMMIADAPIDPSRITMAGMSNGGFMAARYACERAESIAGFASVVGSMRNALAQACQPTVPVPTLLVRGTSDLIVLYARPPGMLPAQDMFELWAGFNGCTGDVTVESLPDTVDDNTQVELQRADGCVGAGDTRLYAVIGGGHAWPDIDPYTSITTLALGRISREFAATDLIWSFLEPLSR